MKQFFAARQSLFTALLLVAVLSAWLLSGATPETGASSNATTGPDLRDAAVNVRVRTISAENVVQ